MNQLSPNWLVRTGAAARPWPRLAGAVTLAAACCLIASPVLDAHGVSTKDGLFLLSLNGPAIIPLI